MSFPLLSAPEPLGCWRAPCASAPPGVGRALAQDRRRPNRPEGRANGADTHRPAGPPRRVKTSRGSLVRATSPARPARGWWYTWLSHVRSSCRSAVCAIRGREATGAASTSRSARWFAVPVPKPARCPGVCWKSSARRTLRHFVGAYRTACDPRQAIRAADVAQPSASTAHPAPRRQASRRGTRDVPPRPRFASFAERIRDRLREGTSLVQPTGQAESSEKTKKTQAPRSLFPDPSLPGGGHHDGGSSRYRHFSLDTLPPRV
jgi:hypothetical protein